MNAGTFLRVAGCNLFLMLLVTMCGWPSVALADAHPFHMCVGEMEWNADNKKWEVGLRVKPEDLIAAIESEVGEKISLNTKADAEVLEQYLTKQFFMVRHPDQDSLQELISDHQRRIKELETLKEQDKLSSIQWIGLEEEKGWCWLYFELDPPRGDEPLLISHHLLLDSIDSQENSVLLKRDGQRVALQFNLKHRLAAVPAAFAE